MGERVAGITGIHPRAFVGREAEIAVFRELLSRAIRGQGHALLIDGEPGIGKTALLRVLLQLARSRNCTVLQGRADDITQQFPMQVMLDCLRGAPAVSLPRTVPLERIVTVVTSLSAQAPVVLAIDDLHWADDESLLAWRRLSELAPGLPLVMIGTCSLVPHQAELSELKRRLAESHQAVITLNPLGPDEVISLVAILAGGEPSDGLKLLTERAGGNPLYVTELVDALVRGKRVRVTNGVADIVTDQQPQALANMITGRLDFLSPQSKRILTIAALLGLYFTAAEVAAVAELAPEELAGVVAEAQAAHVIAESNGRLRFRHLLIRQAMYDGMPNPLRVALHRQAAQGLARAGAGDERVAGQLLATTQLGTNPSIREWLATAAPRMVHRSPRMAAQLFRGAIADIAPGDAERDRLEGALASALLRLNQQQEAADIARRLLARSTDAEGRAEAMCTLGYALLGSGGEREALTLMADVLTDPALSLAWQARTRSVIAFVHALAGRTEDAEAAAREALAQARGAGDAYAVSHSLHVLCLLRARQSGHAEARELATQALAILPGDPDSAGLRSALLVSRMTASRELGRMAEAAADLQAAHDLTDEESVPVQLAHAAAEYYLRVGRWDEAVGQLAAINPVPVLVEYPASGPDDPLPHGIGALIAGHRDDRVTAAAHLKAARRMTSTARGTPPGRAAYLALAEALSAERDGHPERALASLLPVLSAPDAASICLPTLARLAQATGQADLARAAARTAAHAVAREPTAIRRAIAEHCEGMVARDPGLLLNAARTYHDVGLPLERAQATEDAAEVLAAAEQPGRARVTLNEAADGYAALGAEWDIRRADTRLRRYGVRRGRGRSPGSASLTPTEAKIAQRIALGWSTPDIARDMLLSPRTVQTHVSHILRKINGRSRMDIVRASVTGDRDGGRDFLPPR